MPLRRFFPEHVYSGIEHQPLYYIFHYMQLLTIAIPKLEEMQRDGEDGRKKMVAITRYVTVALALIQSTAMAIGFGRQGLLDRVQRSECNYHDHSTYRW